MAALWWHSEVRILSEALANVGELKRSAASAMRQRGYTAVRFNNLEVAGGKSGCWVSIGHFHIADRRFWEVVMCAGDVNATAQAIRDEVVIILRGLRFL